MVFPTLEASSPCASRDAVLATPELLEAILAFVSMRRLLISGQRVCKLWKDAIDRSPQLQEHLYFRPAEHGTDHRGEDGQSSTTIAALAVPNPLLQHRFGHRFFPGHQKGTTWYSNGTLRREWGAVERRDAFMRAGASWRSMLVAQPPPSELVVVAANRAPDPESSIEILRLRRDGPPVRMGFLYDLVCHGVLRHGRGPGVVHVAWAADEMHVEDDLDGPVPPSDRHNIVVQGFYPGLFRDIGGARRDVVSRGDGSPPIWLCEEYDAEMVERRMEEADAIRIPKIPQY
ncbi:hypothetical protein PG985_012931 [Apiospora marii]|uniref:F-box domain-containing protein n=1 Tax=Apiospora marii TaxID=335849 RepID=A0ABR1RD04_9PEZI